jgi:hypothetical protein
MTIAHAITRRWTLIGPLLGLFARRVNEFPAPHQKGDWCPRNRDQRVWLWGPEHAARWAASAHDIPHFGVGAWMPEG